MLKMKQRFYYSNQPFTVHVKPDEQYKREEIYHAILLDEHTYGWIQLMWPGDRITTDPENIESEEIQ